MRRGVCKRFNATKGWGFLGDPAVDGDVLVHQSAILMNGYRQLKPGQTVTYELVKTERGYCAKNVKPVQPERVGAA